MLETVPPGDAAKIKELRLALSDRVRAGELTGFLEIGPEILIPPARAPGQGSSEQGSRQEIESAANRFEVPLPK